MPVGRLNKVAIEHRRQQVAELLLQRVPQWKIAEQMQLSRCMVSRDVKALLQRWQREATDCTARAVAQELAELDALERQVAERFEETHDVEWIHARLRIKERRAKMMGLDDPEVHRLVGPDGGAIQVAHSGSAFARQVVEDPEARQLARAFTDRLDELEQRREHEQIVGLNGHRKLPDNPRLN